MPTFPNRCQHIKVNGTQCGCPALRRNKLCYFHKRHHEERVQLNLDRLKDARLKDTRAKDASALRRAAIDLPVLEDANSIQVSLMQIMRLILTGQLDPKTAGLLLYALQTASANLSRTTFDPDRHDVILNPAAANETLLGQSVWEDDDFEQEDEEEDDDEIDSAREAGIRKAAEFLYSLDAKNAARQQAANAAAVKAAETKPSGTETKPSETKTSEKQPPPKKPPAPAPSVAQQVRDQVRQALPDLLHSLETAARSSG